MKSRILTLALLFLGCTHSLSQENSPGLNKSAPKKKAYKAPMFATWEEWLEQTLNKHSTEGSLEILALTSSGGFHGGGAGNLFVLVDVSTKNANLWTTPPMHAPKRDSQVSYNSYELSPEKASEFLKKKESFSNQPYQSKGFDLYRYTWTQFNFTGNKIQRVSEPVTFDDPFIGSKGSTSHQNIINAFKALKGTGK